MPILYDPTDEPAELEEVVVTGAKLVYYTTLPKSAPIPPPPGDVTVLPPDGGVTDEPPPPDPFDGPEPQSCEDVAYLLQQAQQKKAEYAAARGIVEALGFPDDVLTMLAGAAAAAGLFGIRDQLERFVKAVEIGNQVYSAVKASRAGWAIAAVYFVLWLATRGTEGRWDARIAALQQRASDWNC